MRIGKHLGAQRFQRTSTRRGPRNAAKPRSLKTRGGELPFNVPQVRDRKPYSISLRTEYLRPSNVGS